MTIQARYFGTVIAVCAIWAAVLVTSLFSPDLIHGSQQDHLPVAAMANWLWGSISTAFVLLPLAIRRKDSDVQDGWWFLLAAVTTAIWVAVTFVSILAPRLETGTDPTKIPVGAILSPVIATAATGFVAGFIALLSRSD